MRTARAAAGSAAFFVLAPGTVAGLVPWLITGWALQTWTAMQVAGLVLIGIGLVPLVHAFVQFARSGGTPAPVAPTERLVVTGFNRWVRNPMYVGIVLILLGQVLLFWHVGLLVYTLGAWLLTAAFVRWYEEPTLARQFGAEYDEYRRAVPAWWPRLRRWRPSTGAALGS